MITAYNNTWRANICIPQGDSRVGGSRFWITEWIHHEVLEVRVSLSVGVFVVPVSIPRKIHNVYKSIIEDTID